MGVARLSLLTCFCSCWYSASLADSACASARSSSSCVLQGQWHTVCLAPHVPSPYVPEAAEGRGAACMPALHLAAPSSVPMSCWLPPADMAVPVSAKQSGSSMSPLHCLALSPTRSGLSCSFGLFPFPQHLAEQGHHVQPRAVGSITPSHTSQACTRVAPCAPVVPGWLRRAMCRLCQGHLQCPLQRLLLTLQQSPSSAAMAAPAQAGS